MLDDLPLIQRLSLMAAHGSARQRVLSENVAHANTPGFRARDLSTFADLMGPRAIGAGATPAPKVTRPGHAGAEARSFVNFGVHRIDTPAAPNGNNVVLEDQVIRAAGAESQHRLALRLYAKSAELMRLGLGRLR